MYAGKGGGKADGLGPLRSDGHGKNLSPPAKAPGVARFRSPLSAGKGALGQPWQMAGRLLLAETAYSWAPELPLPAICPRTPSGANGRLAGCHWGRRALDAHGFGMIWWQGTPDTSGSEVTGGARGPFSDSTVSLQVSHKPLWDKAAPSFLEKLLPGISLRAGLSSRFQGGRSLLGRLMSGQSLEEGPGHPWKV